MWPLFLLAWLIIFVGFSTIGLALWLKLFGSIRPPDYLIAKLVGLFVFFGLCWLIGYSQLITLTQLNLLFLWILAVLLAVVYLYQKKPSLSWQHWLISEQILLALLLVFLITKGFYPTVIDGEKPMEMMMLSSVMKAGHLPPEDAWLAGQPLNYYYFGYFVFGSIAKIIGASSFLSFAFGEASIWVLTIIGLFWLGYRLSKNYLIALLAPLLWALIGNLDSLIQLSQHHLDSFDWWRSSRILPGTINEFPAFAFLFGDFHPHMIGSLWLVGLLIVLLAGQKAKLTLGHGLLAGLILAEVFLVSSWSALTAGLLIIGYIIYQRPSWLVVTIGLGTALLLAWPYQAHLQSTWQGLAWVKAQDRSALNLWLTHWGILVLGSLGLVWQWIRQKKIDLSLVIVLAAVFLLITPEFVFVKDIYGYRLNTVFKFYWDAWLLLSLAAALGFGYLLRQVWALKLLVFLALVVGGLYLPLALPERFGHFQHWYGADPERLTFKQLPYLEAPYHQLIKAPSQTKIFDRSGDSFSQDNLLSALTGVPTYLGWFDHERVWRGDQAELSRRRELSDQLKDCSNPALLSDQFHFDYCFDSNGLIKLP